jgi:15-cis-phytoene synthase
MCSPMLSSLGEMVRRHDPDRFLTALFAPEGKREVLFTLYAFNHELARAREAVREPAMALIRLQWWRDVVEGASPRHEVATPLSEAIAMGALYPPDLLAMIEAREMEAEPAIPTLEAWRDYVLGSAGGLAVAAGRALGAPEAALPALRALGAAYGVAGVLRSVPVLAREGRCLLPEDVLAAQGLSAEAVINDPAAPALAAVRKSLVVEGKTWLKEGRAVRLPRVAIAAGLPAVLARRDLARPGRLAGPRGGMDKLAVALAGLRGWV